jgi:TRAP-type C4-dicarboxylate transport system permease small subunit
MQIFKSAVLNIVRWLDWLAAAAIVAMMALTCADVVMRWFRMPIKGTFELISFMGAIAVAGSIAHTLVAQGHVAVNLLVRLLPPRAQGVIECLIACLSGLLFGIMAWQCLLYGQGFQHSGEVSATLQLPLYPVTYGIALGAVVVCLVCLLDLMQAIKKVRGV